MTLTAKRLLPILLVALDVLALALVAPRAQAQTTNLTATMTVGTPTNERFSGYNSLGDACGALTDATFDIDGATHTVLTILDNQHVSDNGL